MKIEYVDGTLLKKCFIGAANDLERNKAEVNALNVFPVPDGDTGTNMSLTMQSAVKQILDINELNAHKVANAASNGSLMGARGNSGVILSQLFRGFANGLENHEQVNTKILANTFKLAANTAYKAVMKPTEGTILTVAREIGDKALVLSEEEEDIVIFLKEIVEYGNSVLAKTPEMLPVLKQAGVVDAGGKGLMVVLTGAYLALTTDDDVDFEGISERKIVDMHSAEIIDPEDIKFGYCTEFIINNTDADPEQFKEQLSLYGDSIISVGNGDLIKVHVHTNNPGEVLEKALLLGELNDIKIDNMRYQHRNLVFDKEKSKESTDTENVNENEHVENKEYGFITVAIGDGIANVFKDLGVDYVIPGGQTMNPSTEDILKAVDKVQANNIIILPNNGNIVLAAEQAKELSEKNLHILKTKTIPEGVVALLSFNSDLSAEDNMDSMRESVENVKTGEVTYAVRDTEIGDVKVKKDDILGISQGEIKAINDGIQKVSLELLKKLVDEDDSLITIFYGEDIKEEEAEELSSLLEDEFDDCDVELLYGGQPLYYFIFSVE
ncbi:MAG TPA: DAK2 domain-containing protein [Tissierellales bacterium]|nr:DAK2 domain-containing protein [Tissierellales bacterium]